MTEQVTPRQTQPAGKKSKSDRVIKTAFILAIIVIVILVTRRQYDPMTIPGGFPVQQDMRQALAQAAKDKRPLLVFFVSSPPGQEDRDNAQKTLAQPANINAIKNGNYVVVQLPTASSLDSEWARAYKVTKLPTTLALTPDGKEYSRREGFIGEIDFRQGLLAGKAIK